MKLVTGGTSRIGREIVKRLGGDVLVHYHQNETLARELSQHVIQADFKHIGKFLKQLGKFDVIVNNFAFVEDGKDLESWERVMRANIILPALLLNHVDQGVVINITSVSARAGVGGEIAYRASKAALNQLSSAFNKPGVRVNAIAPSEIGNHISAEEIAEEVIRVINNTSINNQIIYLWGSTPESERI